MGQSHTCRGQGTRLLGPMVVSNLCLIVMLSCVRASSSFSQEALFTGLLTLKFWVDMAGLEGLQFIWIGFKNGKRVCEYYGMHFMASDHAC